MSGRIRLGGSSFDELITIATSKDGGYVCAGYSNSPISGDKTETIVGQTDYWIVKLDSSGKIQLEDRIMIICHPFIRLFMEDIYVEDIPDQTVRLIRQKIAMEIWIIGL